MPNYVAVELSEQSMLIAVAKSAGRSYQIQRLFEIDLTAESATSELGQQLKEKLTEYGLAKSELIGLVDRKNAEVREVNVPPVPTDELPDLVRFQARNVFASLNENSLFDFMPFDPVDGQAPRVLAIAVPTEIKSRFEAIAEAANLKLKRLIFRPFSLCDLFEALLIADDHRLLILPSQDRFELMVASGKQMVSMRSFKISPNSEPNAAAKYTVGEIRRTLASLKSTLGESGIQQIIVGGNQADWPILESELTETFDLPLVFFAPLGCVDPARFKTKELPTDSERFAAVVGALVTECNQSAPVVDFINPRRPVVKKRDLRKVMIPTAGVAALLVLIVGYGWWLLNQQSKAIAAADKQLIQEVKLNSDSDQLLSELETIDRWMANKIDWREELAYISGKLLTPDDIIISKFNGQTTKTGMQIELISHVSREQENDNTWQHLFDRYEDPVFDSIKEAEIGSIKDHPVLRPFKLVHKYDIEAVVSEINRRATENFKRHQTDAANGEQVPTEADRSEAARSDQQSGGQ